MDNEIIRQPTEQEKKDFTDISFKDKNSARAKFEEELAKKGQEAIKKGLPFATKPARDEFNDYYEDQAQKSMRKNGFVDPNDIKPLKMDWKKYSDINNFDMIDEGEINDPQLTKHNPGLNVMIAFKKYKYHGYANTFTVMEDSVSALNRAQEKRKKLDNK